jgi:arsenite methyltransferase
MGEFEHDTWSKWLLETRFGGDTAVRDQMLVNLGVIRDRVLDGLGPVPEGATLLDVGCGDGLIGFGALARFPGCHVIFSDISEANLHVCRDGAAAAGVVDRCTFLNADATELAGVADRSVDAVTTRSVLIYIADKAAAFRAFARVLRPGGRLSLFEPVSPGVEIDAAFSFWTYDMREVRDLADRVAAVFERSQPAEDPMRDTDERALVAQADAAGFDNIHVQLELVLERRLPERWQQPWDTYINSPWNPTIPSVKEAAEKVLEPLERERFFAHFRKRFESNEGRFGAAHAYLTARKPEG